MIVRGSIGWVCGLLAFLLLPAEALAQAGLPAGASAQAGSYATYGQTASGFSNRSEAVLDSSIWPLTVDRSRLTILQDSLKLRLLDIEIARAELGVSETNIWHRLIPDVHLSASIGVRQLVFIDPTSFVPYTLPKDSYRLTASLSLSGIFSSTQHEQALLSLDQAQTEKAMLEQKQHSDHERQIRERNASQQELDLMQEEMKLLKEILEYTELLFNQGKADFDNLVKAKLQVLHLQQSINTLLNKRHE
ncbi:MAG: TolC family protein [bacterium]